MCSGILSGNLDTRSQILDLVRLCVKQIKIWWLCGARLFGTVHISFSAKIHIPSIQSLLPHTYTFVPWLSTKVRTSLL